MIKRTTKRLNREVPDGDIDSLGYVMQTLQDVRAKQSEIELEFKILQLEYMILDNNLQIVPLVLMFNFNWNLLANHPCFLYIFL